MNNGEQCMLCCCLDCRMKIIIMMVTLTMTIYNLMKWKFFLVVHPERYLRVKGHHKCHANDEAVVPAVDTSTKNYKVCVWFILHRPTASELAHKQIFDKNLPKGKKRYRGTCVRETPQQRVKQFNLEFFSVSNNELLSLACQEEQSVKSSVIGANIKQLSPT